MRKTKWCIVFLFFFFFSCVCIGTTKFFRWLEFSFDYFGCSICLIVTRFGCQIMRAHCMRLCYSYMCIWFIWLYSALYISVCVYLFFFKYFVLNWVPCEQSTHTEREKKVKIVCWFFFLLSFRELNTMIAYTHLLYI